ncbi:protein FAR-RED IMPAIRED RESPONSE 1-like isoform X1 [Malania oleifera]|uniref:protein FAR-RED IMPAIRED RESPONSE 1-like isoform X1 n=1 Tax=Malania oleifera TaxID=397392 RepID=UPI0025AEBBD7|nr:protein FAR-RED IMPAIRED RESPONSE 1-like isoform X1 [Malania oleifera]
MYKTFSLNKNQILFMGIDLEQPSGEHHEGKRQNLNVIMVDTGDELHDRDQLAVNSSNIAGNDKENNGNLGRRILDGTHNVHPGDGVNLNSSTNLEPHDGMEFESKEEAFSFYKEYAKSVGFATIIKASRRSRISGKFIDAKFVCTRYGNKRECGTAEVPQPVSSVDGTAITSIKKKRGRINQSWSKTDCKACMHVKRRQDGRWVIRSFIKEHNHEIFPDQAYYFRGHRNINLGNGNVDALHAIRARTKKMHVSMSRQAGGHKKIQNQNVGIKNQFVGGKQLALEHGDAKVMLDQFLYMQDENPNFFYAIDLNEEQCLRNVLWVDAKGRIDYVNFNDVVFFDTTYIKNEYKLPFTLFIGVNHHFQFLLLGCALVADETKSTFVWLMRAWHRAMGGQAPKVILSDQDNALKQAIAEVFPGSRHCFCLWHILSKIPEKLSYVMRQNENFVAKFNKCIFKSWTDQQFEKRWWKMVDRFDLRKDAWLQSLYEDRRRWMPTYMRDIFLAGMSTSQRTESINSFFDKHMLRKTTLKELLDQHKIILREKYEEEAKADFETWHKQPGLKSPSPFGKQMAALYTHAIFKKFQVEVLGVVACHPKKESEDGANVTYKVQDFEENQDFLVAWNETTSDISCLCRSFEYNGFLCRHAMIVLQMSGVHNIPSQYILKRWTKDAKNREATGQSLDVLESRVQRYNNLCRRAFKLGDEGSLSQESYNIAYNALEEALRKCENMNNSIQNVIEPSLSATHGLHDFDEVNQGNSRSKMNKKSSTSKNGKVHFESEVVTIGMHDRWQQMGHSNLRAPTALDCSYATQESIQGMEQLNSRTPTLDGYFGMQQVVQGMGQLNSIAPNHDDYYGNQSTMHGLGQLNSIARIHDGHYMTQQRMHVLGQLHFRPQTIQSCFDFQDGLQDMGVKEECATGAVTVHSLCWNMFFVLG